MNATSTARTATHAYDARRRGRRTNSMLDRISDGMLAAGGVLLINSVFPLGFELPSGSVGFSAGGLLIAAAIAWIRRPVRRAPVPAQFSPGMASVTSLEAHRARRAA